MPDSDIIDAKLESLGRCLQRIEEKTPASANELATDYDLQDIITVNLQRSIQLCVDVGTHIIALRGWKSPDTMTDTFRVLEEHGALPASVAESMRRAVGFRNVSVHEYDTIDWARVYRLATERLTDFRGFAAAVIRSEPGSAK